MSQNLDLLELFLLLTRYLPSVLALRRTVLLESAQRLLRKR